MSHKPTNPEVLFEEREDVGKVSSSIVGYVMEKRSMTQGDIAQALEVDPSFISLVCSRKRNLRLEHLAKLSELAKVPMRLLIAEAMPIDASKVPEHLRTKHKKYEGLLADSLQFLVDYERSKGRDARMADSGGVSKSKRKDA